jgi:hypothetical protein
MYPLNIFDTIAGLPVHALVVHFAVVLIPLAALGLIAEAFVPAWRARFGLVTLGALTVGGGAAVIAVPSGEQLALHVGLPWNHAQWADATVAAAAFTWLAALAWLWLEHRRTATTSARRVMWTNISRIATIVLSVAALATTVMVGHTGAQAAWANRVGPQAAASASASPATTYTMTQVQQHNTATSCWSAIDGNVYDLTSWVNQHPGGSQSIVSMCGTDGTAAYHNQHDDQARPAGELVTLKIGVLKG